MSAWRKQHNADAYVDEVRGTIPLIVEQIDLLHRIVRASLPHVRKVLDLGCGDGALAATMLDAHPEATAVLVDFSEPMLGRARSRFAGSSQAVEIILADLCSQAWLQKLPPGSRFDVVVSGYAIHHLPNERKQALFREILEMLQPGGLFINLEHVATRSPMARQLFDDMFIDNQTELTRSRGETVNRDEIARRYHTREDQHDNILALVEDQCIWMEAAGFVDVDCYFKILELAMLAGRRPA